MSDADPKLPSTTDESTGMRTVELLRKIESGALDPKAVGAEQRRALVAVLANDGMTTAEIAQILGVSDRTVERDRQAIREAQTLVPDPQLAERMAGRYVSETELAIQRIRKAARGKNVAPAVKIDGEHRCHQMMGELIRSLQRLGFLPTAVERVEADLTHHLGELRDFSDMLSDVQRLRAIRATTGNGDPASERDLLALERTIVQADLSTRVDQVATDTQAGEEENDEAA